MIDLKNPDPYAISITDIAHSLSQLCRFGGHTREFYSVAQHSLMVSLHVPREYAFIGLLHDATEAYLQDVIRPLKQLLPNYADIEAHMWETIAWHFHLSDTIPECVKEMDMIMCATEMRDLLPFPDNTSGYKPLNERLHPMTAVAARCTFMKEFGKLYRQQKERT
jgi:hypothetical protein